MMRSFGLALAAVAVGYTVLMAPGVVGFVLMVSGAVWFWRAQRRWGVRR
ncbi:hypothetical protein [Nocardia abscessus]|nr:hypothetical protein [Nocardia abscessus]